jgi:predicted dehydrogenase
MRKRFRFLPGFLAGVRPVRVLGRVLLSGLASRDGGGQHRVDMKRIRWGMIGCGDVTEVKSGPAFRKVAGSSVVAVMRRNAAAAADYAQRHGIPRWYSDAEALIADSEVDAVYIATPPNTHASYTAAVAAAGKPVYVEKPMARTYAEARAMVDGCEAANVPLFVAYYRRALPQFLQVKAWLDAGAIGAVLGVRIEFAKSAPAASETAAWRYDVDIAGGGLLFDLGSHQMDLLDFLLGPIAEVEGNAVNLAGLYPVEDTVAASFRFQSGTLGSALWCFASAPGQSMDRIVLIGREGRITFSCFDTTRVVLENGQGVTEAEPPAPAHVQQPLIESIVDALLGKGTCPSTGTTAMRTAWVLDRIVGRL